MINIKDLREALDVETVLDALGVYYKEKSNRLWFICPFHNDRNIGSAYITKDGYFICHSCGKKADIFDIVMQIKGIGFSEATIFIAELSGGASHFNIENDQISKTTKEYQSMRLTPAEISALNIPPEINLKKLFFFDKEQYKKVVLERAKDRKQVYENMISEYGSRSSPKAYKIFTWIKELPCNTASIYAALSSELKTRIMICEEVIERLT